MQCVTWVGADQKGDRGPLTVEDRGTERSGSSTELVWLWLIHYHLQNWTEKYTESYVEWTPLFVSLKSLQNES